MASMICLGASVTGPLSLEVYGYNSGQPEILRVIAITNYLTVPSW